MKTGAISWLAYCTSRRQDCDVIVANILRLARSFECPVKKVVMYEAAKGKGLFKEG